MAHRKKTSSPVLDKANARLAGIKSIDNTLDLGDGLSVETYQAAINDLQQKQNEYNTTLSVVDVKYANMAKSAMTLTDMTERMLLKVGAKYGKDSEPYQQAGGVRKSLRKKIVRKVVVKA